MNIFAWGTHHSASRCIDITLVLAVYSIINIYYYHYSLSQISIRQTSNVGTGVFFILPTHPNTLLILFPR